MEKEWKDDRMREREEDKHKWMDGLTNTQSNAQTARQIGMQANRQTDRHTYVRTHGQRERDIQTHRCIDTQTDSAYKTDEIDKGNLEELLVEDEGHSADFIHSCLLPGVVVHKIGCYGQGKFPSQFFPIKTCRTSNSFITHVRIVTSDKGFCDFKYIF